MKPKNSKLSTRPHNDSVQVKRYCAHIHKQHTSADSAAASRFFGVAKCVCFGLSGVPLGVVSVTTGRFLLGVALIIMLLLVPAEGGTA